MLRGPEGLCPFSPKLGASAPQLDCFAGKPPASDKEAVGLPAAAGRPMPRATIQGLARPLRKHLTHDATMEVVIGQWSTVIDDVTSQQRLHTFEELVCRLTLFGLRLADRHRDGEPSAFQDDTPLRQGPNRVREPQLLAGGAVAVEAPSHGPRMAIPYRCRWSHSQTIR